jgi:hypothetical protein
MTTDRLKPPDSVHDSKHNRTKTGGWIGVRPARRKATTPFSRGRHRSHGNTATKKQPSLACACPPWHEGQVGRWHGPCPDAGNICDWGHPRRLSGMNGMDGTSGYRVRMDVESATPLTGPTYRARTRYSPCGRKLPSGTWDRPAVPRRNPRPSERGGCQGTTRCCDHSRQMRPSALTLALREPISTRGTPADSPYILFLLVGTRDRP